MGKFGLRRGPDATVLPFLSHQVIEYLASLYLLQVGTKVHGTASTVCYVLGSLMLAAAAFSGKPLGGGRRISRPKHRFVDLALIVAVAASPFVFGFSDQNSALIRLEALAIALVALMRFTNYSPPQAGMGREIARGLRAHATRKAGQAVGRRLGRRPPGR